MNPIRLWPALALACAWMLAACGGSDDSSVPPVVVPPPPGLSGPLGAPVTQTVTPAGGTVVATTLGVKVSLIFPQDAVAADTVVTITPQTPAASDFVSVKLEPGGVFFAHPVTAVLEFPAAVVPDATTSLRQRLSTSDAYVATAVDRTARTLTATLTTFGSDKLQALAAAQAGRSHALRAAPAASAPLPPSGTLTAEQFATIDERVAAARQRIALLSEFGYFEDAFALALSIVDLLQRTGDPGYAAVAVPFFTEAHDTACTGLAAAIVAARTAPITAAGAFKPLGGKILYWESLLQRLGGNACPGTTAIDAMHELLARELAFLKVQIPAATTRAQFNSAVADVKDTRTLKAEAGALQGADGTPPSAQGSASRARATAARPGPLAVDLSGMVTSFQVELIDPALAPAREAAWTEARSTGSLADYQALLDAFGPAPKIQQDLQFLRTRLDVTSRDAMGKEASLASTLGFASVPPLPTDPRTSASMLVVNGGLVTVNGIVAALECANPGTETLKAYFENVEVGSATGSGVGLLQGILVTMTPQSLLAAAGLPTDDKGVHPLRIRRVASPCIDELGLTDDLLGTVMLDFDTPAFTAAATLAFSVDCTTGENVYATDLSMPLSYTVTPCPGVTTKMSLAFSDAKTLTFADESSGGGVFQHYVRYSATFAKAGTVTITVRPAWAANIPPCEGPGHGVFVVVGWVDIRDPVTNVAVAVAGYNSCDFVHGTANVTKSYAVGAGDTIPFGSYVSGGNVTGGSGTAFTMHFEPTP
jgi:hypothetical protein